MKRLIYILLLLVFAVSCEEEIPWQLDQNVNPRLVVEGIVTNNPDLNYVKLSLPVVNPNSTPIAISGATVVIASSAGNTNLSESPTKPGLYIPDSPLIGVVGEAYRLYINLDSYEFISSIVWMKPVEALKEFRSYAISSVPGAYGINPREENDPSITEYLVTYPNPEIQDDTLKSIFYTFTLSSIDVSQFFKPRSEFLIFPESSTIIRTKYSMTPEYENYIRGMLSETEWKGGWFDVLPGNISTNISQGGVGYFAASSVLRDTVYFNK